jgi:protein-tyrosine-phosphatase
MESVEDSYALRRVLFVCSGNSERSPTAEKYFRKWKGVWETKSAGIRPSTEELGSLSNFWIGPI